MAYVSRAHFMAIGRALLQRYLQSPRMTHLVRPEGMQAIFAHHMNPLPPSFPVDLHKAVATCPVDPDDAIYSDNDGNRAEVDLRRLHIAAIGATAHCILDAVRSLPRHRLSADHALRVFADNRHRHLQFAAEAILLGGTLSPLTPMQYEAYLHLKKDVWSAAGGWENPVTYLGSASFSTVICGWGFFCLAHAHRRLRPSVYRNFLASHIGTTWKKWEAASCLAYNKTLRDMDGDA